MKVTFSVIDKTTGKKPDLKEIALNEEWAKHLIYCDMEGFAIEQDGTLILLDECGGVAYCPEDRFEVRVGTIDCYPCREFEKPANFSIICERSSVIDKLPST